MKSSTNLAMLLAAVALTCLTHATSAQRPERACWNPASDYAKISLGQVEGVASDPGQAWYRDRLGIKQIPVESVFVVADSTKCVQASRLILDHRGHPDSATRAVQLFRIGEFYWADDPALAGNWPRGFILDSCLTKILKAF